MSNHLKSFLKVYSDWLGDFFDWISLVESRLLVNLNLTCSAGADLKNEIIVNCGTSNCGKRDI